MYQSENDGIRPASLVPPTGGPTHLIQPQPYPHPFVYLPNVMQPGMSSNPKTNPINPNLQAMSQPHFSPMMMMPQPYPFSPFGFPGYPPSFPYTPNPGFYLPGAFNGAPMPQSNQGFNERPKEEGESKLFESIRASRHQNNSAPSFKYRSGEEIVADFKSQSLPRIRLRRLVRLQALMRGFIVRKFKIPQMRLKNALIEDYAARKIEEFLQDSMIPDLVLEVITYNKYNQDYSLYSPEMRASVEYVDNIIRRTVMKLASEAVNETITGWVKEYTRKKNQENPQTNDPHWLLSNDLIYSSILPVCKELASQCVGELVNEYIIESQFYSFFKGRLLPSIINDIALDGLDECIIEDLMEKYIVNIMTNISEPLGQLVCEEEYYILENEELDAAFKNHMEREMLSHLLDNAVSLLGHLNLEFIADQTVKYNRFSEIDKDDLMFEGIEMPEDPLAQNKPKQKEEDSSQVNN